MIKEIPALPPSLQQKVLKFREECNTVLDRYVSGFEIDLNRHACKHGPMPEERALNDLARILARDVPHSMMAGLLAAAILRLINRKREGRG